MVSVPAESPKLLRPVPQVELGQDGLHKYSGLHKEGKNCLLNENIFLKLPFYNSNIRFILFYFIIYLPIENLSIVNFLFDYAMLFSFKVRKRTFTLSLWVR